MQLLAVIMTFVLLAVGFAWYLIKQDRGEREPVKALWKAFGFGVIGVAIAATIEPFIIPDIFDGSLPLGTILWGSIVIGLVEEASKSLLLIWYIRGKRYFNEHTDGIIYFALA